MKSKVPDFSKFKCRGIVKWQPFNPVPGFGKKLYDSIHNNEEMEMSFDDDYYVSLDYMLSEVSNEGKRAAIKYHDGKRYKLLTGSIASFGNGKIGLETDEGTFIELEIGKVANIEPL